MTPSLADVARQAGVSTATASRALNAKRGVSQGTRNAVYTAADELGYSRAARQTPSAALGVIVPELANPVFAAFAQNLSTALRQSGHSPILGTETAAGISEDEWIEMLLELDVGGIIIVSGMHADTHASTDRYERLRGLGIPLVFVNGFVEGLDAVFLSADDVAAMTLAVNHLAALGHRTVGLAVGPERYVPVIRKTNGFLRASERANLEPLLESTLFTMEGGAASALHLVERGATAIVCASDVMALGAVRACVAAGIDVPGDVSIVGFDDSAIAACAGPPLTTLRQPVAAISAAAVRLLLEELEGAGTHRQEFLFQPELIVRSSTGPMRRRPTPTTAAHPVRP
jgi:LacI family transcriptional regulator, repressor for deo operon, udp, cdd, tsx, nupC, and nupG